MKRFPAALKLGVLLVCIVLLVAFSFFDIIDWIVPGDFPGWVYVAENVVWAAIGIFALVALIKKSSKRH